mgnify:CR=1 FL=1
MRKQLTQPSNTPKSDHLTPIIRLLISMFRDQGGKPQSYPLQGGLLMVVRPGDDPGTLKLNYGRQSVYPSEVEGAVIRGCLAKLGHSVEGEPERYKRAAYCVISLIVRLDTRKDQDDEATPTTLL